MAAVGQFTVDDDLGNLMAMYERMAHRAEDMIEPLHDAADAIRYELEIQFDTEGGLTDAGHWVELSPNYREWKGRDDILSLTDELHQDAIAVEPVVVDNVMEYTIENPLAAIHQSGAVRQKGGVLPARPLIVLAPSTHEDIDAAFEDWAANFITDEVKVSGYSYTRAGRLIEVGSHTRRRPGQ